ncbi:MAG: type III pantothenate kinase [candidate division WOR-3 bacterium]
MILAVLIGNTNTRAAVFSGSSIVRRRIVSTALIRRRPSLLMSSRTRITDSALASVVPTLTRPVANLLFRIAGRPPLIIGVRARTGLRFKYNRRQLGADRVCAAVGAFNRYHRDTIVVDFGTAVTVNVVTADGTFLAGAILPGIRMMLDALAEKTGRLPRIALSTSHRAAGRDTASALRTGVFNLTVGGVTRIIDRVRAETGRNWLVVATGGGATFFRRHIPAISRTDPDLALRGLAELLYFNRCGSAPRRQYRRSE